jgi:hypothetical protein
MSRLLALSCWCAASNHSLVTCSTLIKLPVKISFSAIYRTSVCERTTKTQSFGESLPCQTDWNMATARHCYEHTKQSHAVSIVVASERRDYGTPNCSFTLFIGPLSMVSGLYKTRHELHDVRNGFPVRSHVAPITCCNSATLNSIPVSALYYLWSRIFALRRIAGAP